jgi:hypothetical protein
MNRFTTPIAPLLFIAALVLGAIPVSAHEFWLLPGDFQPETGDTLKVEVRNGQKFKGGALGYFANSVKRFEVISNRVRHPVKARSGDFPALATRVKEDGLMVILYQSTRSRLVYRSYGLFTGFIEHKRLGPVVARHDARGLPHEGVTESYIRFSKTLVGAGDGAGQDMVTGMETELVALANPYTDDLSAGLPVRLFYKGAPRPHEQIEIFEKSPRGAVSVSTVMTNGNGVGMIPVKKGYTYMLDSEVMREPSAALAASDDVMWESLWANLTFAVPE